MRIRTIKPEFFLHEELYDLEKETKLPIRIAYAGLWCAADREGRFRWEPRKLKAQILPYEEIDFSRVLDALTTRAFLVRYASGRVEYGAIPSFKKHQFVNPREKPSDIPEPPDSSQVADSANLDASTTREARVSDASSTRLFPSLPNNSSIPKGESEGKTDHYHPDARAALHILNEACGAHFRETDTNLTVISARLREPEVTLSGVRLMILRQCKRWKGTSQAEYLRPETLFGKTKFDSYYATRELPINQDDGRSGAKRFDRNAGTANEGRAHLYEGRAQSIGVPTKDQVQVPNNGAPPSV